MRATVLMALSTCVAARLGACSGFVDGNDADDGGGDDAVSLARFRRFLKNGCVDQMREFLHKFCGQLPTSFSWS